MSTNKSKWITRGAAAAACAILPAGLTRSTSPRTPFYTVDRSGVLSTKHDHQEISTEKFWAVRKNQPSSIAMSAEASAANI